MGFFIFAVFICQSVQPVLFPWDTHLPLVGLASTVSLNPPMVVAAAH
jgi:hypothetical protein